MVQLRSQMLSGIVARVWVLFWCGLAWHILVLQVGHVVTVVGMQGGEEDLNMRCWQSRICWREDEESLDVVAVVSGGLLVV